MAGRVQENQQRPRTALWLNVQVFPSAVLLALILRYFRANYYSKSFNTTICNADSIITFNSNSNSNPIVHITYDIISVSLFAIYVSLSPVQGFKGCGSVDNGKL